MSIAVSRTNPNHLIAACNYNPIPGSLGIRKVFYGISTNGLLGSPALSESGYLPIPQQFPTALKFFDPMTAASPTTDALWVGCVLSDGQPAQVIRTGIAVWPNAAGTGVLTQGSPAVARSPLPAFDDKGFLAVGPDPNTGQQKLYATFTRRQVEACGYSDYLAWHAWDTSTPPALLTDEPGRIDPGDPGPGCDRRAFGVMPVVVPSGPGTPRLVVAYREGATDFFQGQVQTCYRDASTVTLPSGWGASHPLIATTTGQVIHGFDHNFSIPGTVGVQTFPSIAVNRWDPTRVAVAFAGSADAMGSDQNVDIYVALSEDGGRTFPQINRITDAMLGDLAGTDQFYPAVAFDQYGGFNIVYLRISPDIARPVPLMSVSYARLPTFNAPTPSVLPLTPLFPVPHDPYFPNNQGINEYIGIDSTECIVYAAYFQCEPETNYATTNMYVSRISLCIADTDDSGFVDSGDVAAYNAAFVAQAPSADLNRDGACNLTDFGVFMNAYACGCGTPQ